MSKSGRSLAERVERIRKYGRGNEPLPKWSAEQWVNVAMVKLGHAAQALASDQGPMSKRVRNTLDAEGVEHLLACAAVCMDAVESLSGLDESQLVTIVLGTPRNDKVLAEIKAVAEATGTHISEALAMLVGLGVQTAKQQGFIGDRASTPMTRGELLREVMTMLEHEE